jgi:hypothetical protein
MFETMTETERYEELKHQNLLALQDYINQVRLVQKLEKELIDQNMKLYQLSKRQEEIQLEMDRAACYLEEEL